MTGLQSFQSLPLILHHMNHPERLAPNNKLTRELHAPDSIESWYACCAVDALKF
jgi:hypothetical protein